MRRADTLWIALAVATLLSWSAVFAQQAGPVTVNEEAVAGEAPAPAADPAPENGTVLAGERKELDTLITRLSLREMDLGQALRLLAEATGINLAVGNDVEGKVTCNLTNVTARVALDTFVRTNGCTYTDANGVILVLKQPPASQGGLAAAVTEIAPKMVRITVQVPYSGTETDSSVVGMGAGYGATATAAKATQSIEDTLRGMLTPLGRIAYYPRQHLCIIEDTEENVALIQDFIARLWSVPPQVYIESSLLEVSLEDGEDLGFRWNIGSKISGSGKISQATGLPGDYNGTLATSAGPSLGLDRLFSFGIINSNLNVVLEALATRRRVELRSNPRVLVMNHRTASIVVGQEIPYLSSVESTAAQPIRTYDFKEVAVRLDVTPHVSTEDGMIFMDVHPSVKSVIGYTDDPKQPILSTRETATNVSVFTGSTLIIGGLVQRNTNKTFNEVPVLGRIPILGWFFRQKSVDDTKNDLIFLLSPTIVSPEIMEKMLQENRALIAEPPPHPGESPTYLPKW